MAAIALLILTDRLSNEYHQTAQDEVNRLIDEGLDNIARGVFQLVQTENEAIQQQVARNLVLAQQLLDNAGGVNLASEKANWTAHNQFSHQESAIQLPKVNIGNQWVGQVSDPAVRVAVVDEIARLTGGTATIFQIMNEQGDMLRVATTVADEVGHRAIGTYIPVLEPDGTTNVVISAVLKGQVYQGRAFVVNKWYLTAYMPLRDSSGQLVGMLYVGVKQDDIVQRVRAAILNTRVGRTGYVFVLGGHGRERGCYLISKDGQRDGENIWKTADANGNYFIQTMVSKALALKPGELDSIRYLWQNPGESLPRWKIARLAYFAPWDWVIGVSVYEDDLQTYWSVLNNGRIKMMTLMGVAGLLVCVVIGSISLLMARSITRPVLQITAVAEKIINGDLRPRVGLKSRDEIGLLGQTFDFMTQQLHLTLEGLRKSEEQYRVIVDNAIEGIFEVDLDGKLLSANPSMARMLGYSSPGELVGLVGNVRHQLFADPSAHDIWQETLHAHGELAGREYTLRRLDQSQLQVLLNANVVSDTARRPLFVVGFITDITGRKQAEEARNKLEVQLYQVQKLEAIGTLAGGIAHDFNNILSAILSYTDLAKMDARGNQAVLDSLTQVRKAGERASDLVRQILAFSRQSRPDYKPTRLHLVVQEALELLRSTLPASVEIVAEIRPDTPPVMADGTQIHQVILNLCTNAAHAMRQQSSGRLSVSLEAVSVSSVNGALPLSPGLYAKLKVSDSGCGMNADTIKHIFDPFFTTKAPGQGTGLGLAVVHGIVKSHQGVITVDSHPGQGTVFEVYLPTCAREEVPTRSVANSTMGHGERVLLVDDEPAICAVCQKLLERMGFKVTPIGHPQMAVELFKKDPAQFDVVITDYSMPEMTGMDLARQLIAIRPDMAIILASGNCAPQTREMAEILGIREIVAKPVTPQELANTILRVLRQDRKTQPISVNS